MIYTWPSLAIPSLSLLQLFLGELLDYWGSTELIRSLIPRNGLGKLITTTSSWDRVSVSRGARVIYLLAVSPGN